MQAIQTLKDTRKVESLKKDVLQAIAPYTDYNMLRLDYLVTVAIKDERQEITSLSAVACAECKVAPQ